MLVGRDAELRELLGATATALAGGRGFTALVGGDAGIGKTRLATEFADRLRADGVPVAWAACRQDGGAPPYWPWAQLLGRLGRADALAAPHTAEPELARFLLFEAVGDALRAAAPVLLVLDDLHWADDPSLRLLDALGAHVGAAPVLVLGTYRDTEPDAAPMLAAIAAERRIVLRGLSAADLGPALTDATGELISVDVVGALHRRTGGNPFFAAEIVRLLRAEGTVREGSLREGSLREGALREGALRDDSAQPVPTSVRAVLDRRLDRLPDTTEKVLRAASTLDAGMTTGVDAVLLAAVAGSGPAELAALLAPAVEARLLLTDEGRYRFPHALVADTLTARTPPAQRLELHRRAGAALDARFRGGMADPADAAHQMLAAARLSGDPEEARAAAAAGALAARAAVERTAYEDAVGWLEAGLALLANAPGEPGESPDRGDLLCALGEAALAAGDPVRSRRAFVDAAGHARRHDRPELFAAAALGAAGGAAGFEVDMTDPDRATLLVEALDALPDTDSALRSALSARLSVALAFTGTEQQRRDLADDAVAMARRVDDPRALAVALAASCDALAGPDHVVVRRAAAEEIITCAQRVRDRTRELLGRRLRLVALAEAGEWVDVDREIEAYSRVAETVRQPGLTWYVPLWRGTRATMLGDLAAEAEHAAELSRQVERSGSGNAELLALTQFFVRELDAGGAGLVLTALDRFQQLAPEYLGAASYCTVALLRAVNGEPAEAARLLEAYLVVRAETPPDSEWLPEMVQAAMTSVLIDHREAAATVYATIAPYAGLFAIEGIAAGTWGCVDAHLGRLARMLGRSDDAGRHFAAALELNADAGPALAARTRGWAADGRAASATAGAAAAERTASEGVFRRDGEVWALEFAGREVRLRDSKGLRDIAALLARPGRDVAVHELTGTPAGLGTGAFELADRTAIEAYRRRLVDLEQERDDAEAMYDPVRAERAATERDALVDELAAVTGLGGRSRRAGSDAERMRKAVGNRIRQTLGRIEEVHPELGRHLRVSVRTGTFCRYDPDREVRWQLRGEPGE